MLFVCSNVECPDCVVRMQGSSALQIVPALQPRVKKLYNYVRGKTWLAVPFGESAFKVLLGREPQQRVDCG